MIKNIVITVLALAMIFFVVLANIKAHEAEKQNIQAQLNLELAKENEARAREDEEKSVEAVAIANQKIDELQRALEVCK